MPRVPLERTARQVQDGQNRKTKNVITLSSKSATHIERLKVTRAAAISAPSSTATHCVPINDSNMPAKQTSKLLLEVFKFSLYVTVPICTTIYLGTAHPSEWSPERKKYIEYPQTSDADVKRLKRAGDRVPLHVKLREENT